MRGCTVSEEAVDEAVEFLLEEFSYLLTCSQTCAAPNIAYVYHRRWPIFEGLINGKYDGVPKDNKIGFAIFRRKENPVVEGNFQ